MFGWRKRSEGFEWHEYVRTTILVRRANRQKRIEDARVAAVERAKEARDRQIEAVAERVNEAKAGAARAARSAAGALGAGVIALARSSYGGLKRASANGLRLVSALPRPERLLPDAVENAVSLSALYAGDLPRRWRKCKPYLLPTGGLLVLVLALGPMLAPDGGAPATQAPSVSGRTSATTTKLAVQANAGSEDGVVSGRATALSGDMLRVGGRLIRLAGIEAPVAGQICERSGGRTFDCASAAASALRKLAGRHRIVCELSGHSENGADLANCRASDTDVARELVRAGAVFAAAGRGADYASEEELAQTEKLGIWQKTPERPDAWRAKIWEEAKRSAPEGCPIKGIVRGGGRLYAMPWTSGYDGRKVREVKGERWFCSEDEAQAAGFRLAETL